MISALMHEEVCHSSHSQPVGTENETEKMDGLGEMEFCYVLGLIALVVGKVRRLIIT